MTINLLGTAVSATLDAESLALCDWFTKGVESLSRGVRWLMHGGIRDATSRTTAVYSFWVVLRRAAQRNGQENRHEPRRTRDGIKTAAGNAAEEGCAPARGLCR